MRIAPKPFKILFEAGSKQMFDTFCNLRHNGNGIVQMLPNKLIYDC